MQSIDSRLARMESTAPVEITIPLGLSETFLISDFLLMDQVDREEQEAVRQAMQVREEHSDE